MKAEPRNHRHALRPRLDRFLRHAHAIGEAAIALTYLLLGQQHDAAELR